MGCVMMTCPVTRKAISTGIDTELATLRQAFPFSSSTRCTACGGEHRWSHSDVWICETLHFEQPDAA